MIEESDPGQSGTGEADGRFEWLLDLGTVPSENREAGRGKRPTSKRAKRQEPPLSDQALVQILTKVPLFRDLPSHQLKKILRFSTSISLEPGQDICTMGANSDGLYILISGRLAVLAQDDLCVAIVHPVTTVGEMGFVTKRPRTATLKAVEPSSLLSLQSGPLHAMLHASPALHLRAYRNIIEILSNRIIDVNSYVRSHLLARREQDSRIAALERRTEIAVKLLAEAAGLSRDEAMARIDAPDA
jgi:CRP-like cAMP-binding protein